jgi:hypothetical protein
MVYDTRYQGDSYDQTCQSNLICLPHTSGHFEVSPSVTSACEPAVYVSPPRMGKMVLVDEGSYLFHLVPEFPGGLGSRWWTKEDQRERTLVVSSVGP